MMSCGKLENVKAEMKRMGIDVLGLSEVTYWPHYVSQEFDNNNRKLQ